ncbi:hypothetical protein [Pacificibacter maritimus]|nr:hypothetical protein [Pacificibacter maritimus]
MSHDIATSTDIAIMGSGIKGPYPIGASTHPRSGLSGGSGVLTAKELGA